MRYTPENITSLENNEIFVFGSNLQGRHGAGAAKTALKWGAKIGIGEGLVGQTYALPTREVIPNSRQIRSLSLDKINDHIQVFLDYALENPDLIFLVTPIGTGKAGYQTIDIAPLFFFRKVPTNVILPQSFWEYLDNSCIK